MNIYVANFSLDYTNETLQKMFSPYGEVVAAEVAIDSFTDKSRGFGHVDMPDEEQAKAAIAALHGKEVDGKVLTVHEAQPKEERKGSYKVGSGLVNQYRFRKN